MRARGLLLVSWLLLATAFGACSAPQAQTTPERAALVADLSAFAERQMQAHGIPAVSLAVLDLPAGADAEWSWVGSFGEARPDSVWPVASISKLVTDTVVMRMVERGELDLDRPVREYLPDFAVRNESGIPITLRHLMSHRSGMVREPPVGHYFDRSEPSLEATVTSLNDTALVYAPGARYKYSNAGIGVVGRVAEVVAGRPFPELAEREVLRPLGMADSSFAPRADLDRRLPPGIMWTYDGREIPMQYFRYGFGPAANLRSTVQDLLRFAKSWFPHVDSGRVLSRESMAAMSKLQFAEEGAEAGVGLGFFVGRHDGRLRIRHGGATYGYAALLSALPEEGLAVAVVCSVDFANPVAESIGRRALDGLLAHRQGRVLEPPVWPVPVGAERARAMHGRYGDAERWFDLLARGEEVYYLPSHGEGCRMRALGDELVSDDLTSAGTRRMVWGGDHVEMSGRQWPRLPDAAPPSSPEEWSELIGEYGWEHNSLVIYEDHGRLCAQIEWLVRSPLEEVAGDRFRFADGHMYAGEHVEFVRNAAGEVYGLRVGPVLWPRRAIGTEAGATFKIEPQHSPAALRRMAAEAEPPEQPPGLRSPDLVELRDLDPTIRYDIRYATTNNFMGMVFYEKARAMMQRPAAEALVRAHRALGERDYGVLVHDAYRPWSVTKMFWDATPEHLKEFVADPSRGSRHNRGCAVDLTLYDRETGAVIEMPGGYDEFTPRAYPDYPGGTDRQRWHRELLRAAMEAAGFTIYEREWWHFDFETWREYPVLDEPLTGDPLRER